MIGFELGEDTWETYKENTHARTAGSTKRGRVNRGEEKKTDLPETSPQLLARNHLEMYRLIYNHVSVYPT